MTELCFGEKLNQGGCVLALGFFDCVHMGHRHLFARAKELSQKLNAPFVAITFENNPFSVLGEDVKPIYDYESRKALFRECGVDVVLKTKFDEAFMSMPPQAFLSVLKDTLAPAKIVCGSDYRFGQFAAGNPDAMKEYFSEDCVVVVDFVQHDGQKVSSGEIRGLLEDGKIEEANFLLGAPYFVLGQVAHGRGVGREYRIPTINFAKNNSLVGLQDGVYGTKVKVDGEEYFAVTNIGPKPTFQENESSIETYIIGFAGDLYGKEISVQFIKRLRDVCAFCSPAALYEQIKKDLRWYL